MAARALGYAELPVVFVDMTPEQMRIATLRHNRARGSEDITLTAALFHDLESLGALKWAQDSLDLTDAEVNKLLEDIPAPEALSGEDFNEAWVPDQGGIQSTETTQIGEVRASLTPAAISETRRREEALKKAKTEEEKKTIRQESDITRYSFTFTGAEAKTVDTVLVKEPAKTLLRLCQLAIEVKWTNT
jgi:ParB-like chromosome segregation protein Spo0J